MSVHVRVAVAGTTRAENNVVTGVGSIVFSLLHPGQGREAHLGDSVGPANGQLTVIDPAFQQAR